MLPGARCGSDTALPLRVGNAWNDLFPPKYWSAFPPAHGPSRAVLLVPCRHQQETLHSFIIPVKMLTFNIQAAELDKNAAGVPLLDSNIFKREN